MRTQQELLHSEEKCKIGPQICWVLFTYNLHLTMSQLVGIPVGMDSTILLCQNNNVSFLAPLGSVMTQKPTQQCIPQGGPKLWFG